MKPKAVKNSQSPKRRATTTKCSPVNVSAPNAVPAAPQRAVAAAEPSGSPALAPAKARNGKPQAKDAQPLTTIAAKIDVGWGNVLYVRGQGDGLSWEHGTPLHCVNGSTWLWATATAKDKVVFKLLINDQVWAQGEDLSVEAGKRIEVEPVF